MEGTAGTKLSAGPAEGMPSKVANQKYLCSLFNAFWASLLANNRSSCFTNFNPNCD